MPGIENLVLLYFYLLKSPNLESLAALARSKKMPGTAVP